MQAVSILAPNNQGVAPQVILHRAQLASEEKKLPIEEALPLKASLQIKAAEYWLKLGEADQALRELEAPRSRIWTCAWAIDRATTLLWFMGS